MEEGEGLKRYQLRRRVLWDYERRDLGLLMFLVQTEGSTTVGWLIRRQGTLTRLLAWFRGKDATQAVVRALIYAEHQERARGEPVLFCLDHLFFIRFSETMEQGGSIDYRSLDREIERCLLRYGHQARKVLASVEEEVALLERTRARRSFWHSGGKRRGGT